MREEPLFLNLYDLAREEFENFNYSDTVGRFEPVSSDDFRARLRNSYREEHAISLEPYFFDAMRLTLSRGARQAFFRSHPNLPATERDYYLSKHFQFLYIVLEVRYGLRAEPEWEVQIQVEATLDPNQEWVPEASTMPEVNWWEFYKDTRQYDLQTVLQRLPKHVNAGSGSPTPASKRSEKGPGGRRGPKADMTRHLQIAAVVDQHGPEWRNEETLLEICDALDQNHVRVPASWLTWARSWSRAVQEKKHQVTKAIQYSLGKRA
jgi:hypothetical protein